MEVENPDQGKDKVLEMWARVKSLGIDSIPTLLVDARFMLNGAVPAGEIFETLVRASKDPSGERVFE